MSNNSLCKMSDRYVADVAIEALEELIARGYTVLVTILQADNDNAVAYANLRGNRTDLQIALSYMFTKNEEFEQDVEKVLENYRAKKAQFKDIVENE